MIDITVLVLLGALTSDPVESSLIVSLLEQIKIYGQYLIQTNLENISSCAVWVFFLWQVLQKLVMYYSVK